MDKRKLKSRNSLVNKQAFHSTSALPNNNFGDSVREELLSRSMSVGGKKPTEQNKRKKIDESNNKDDDESNSDTATKSPFPEKIMNSKKKKKRCIESDNENNISSDEETESLECLGNVKEKSKSLASNKSRKRSNESDNNDDSTNNGGKSYINNILAEWDKSSDKSPSKSSTSSQGFREPREKSRRTKLRAPVLPKSQNSSSKFTIEKRNNEKKNSKGSYMSSFDSQILKTPEKSQSKIAANKSPERKTNSNKKNLKNILSKVASKSTNEGQNNKSLIDNIESDAETEMSFSDDDLENCSAAKSSKKSPPCKNKSPIKKKSESTQNSIQQVRETISPDLSPIKSLRSPAKNQVTLRRKKISKETDSNLFVKFLNKCGIYLSIGDHLHTATCDPQEVIRKMKDYFENKEASPDDIIKCWNDYIEDENNLTKSLHEIKIETSDGVQLRSKATALSKILLNVPNIQVEVLDTLFRKLVDAVITTESSDDAPWAQLMLQQFRFLENMIDPEILVSKLEELLQSSPEWFQRDIIVFIPDIVYDTQHHQIAEILSKLMENNKDLTNIILDCIYNLVLGNAYREEIRQKVLSMLENGVDKCIIPSITRFVLHNCGNEATALKSLNVLRQIDMRPRSKEKVNDCYTYQEFMINAIKMSLLLSKEVAQAAVTLIKNTDLEPTSLDVILLFLLYETTSARKKMVETTLNSHIKDGHYKSVLFQSFYDGFKQVAKKFQNTALNLAISLLKADNQSHIEFGIDWTRLLFVNQADTMYKQREIMEKLLILMGNKDRTVKNALQVLCRMAQDNKEKRYLEQHAGYLRSLLEKIDNLPFEEVTTLYHLLHGLCTTSEAVSNILQDDLSIIMQKQLYSSNMLTKCKGVLGAVMAIKHLSMKTDTLEAAVENFNKVLTSVKTCVRAQGLFYDRMSQILMSSNTITQEFLDRITESFETEFIENCLITEENYKGSFVPKYGLNEAKEMTESYYINFGDSKAAILIPVLFRLLRICHLRSSNNLESINAVLGFPVLMPNSNEVSEEVIADHTFHCINWFREIISGFITQEDNLLREQVLKRLSELMNLQGELGNLISICDSRYQPSACYFHYFPIPQFHKLDKKGGKKKGTGKKLNRDKSESNTSLNKNSVLEEWESWKMGSSMTIKNPAFFRQFDAKILNLLDVNMDMQITQSTSQHISIAQVCFIIKELLGMFENEVSESFIRDLIQLLPKICNKMQKIIEDLRESDNEHEKEAVKLFLKLLATIFSWKEFQNSRYNTLLRDGLRTLASMINQASGLLRSCKDLVAEAYKYFESLVDIVSQISLAVALVNMCFCLMKHSTTFSESCKNRQAEMAYSFLCLEWREESHGAEFKNSVKELIKSWMENEPDPLEKTAEVLVWLTEEAEDLEKANSHLKTLRSVTKANIHILVKELFVGLIKGIEQSLKLAERDPERIKIWLQAGSCFESLATVCKSVKNNNGILVHFLRYSSTLYQGLLSNGMKVLEQNVKYQPEDVMNVIKYFQRGGRLLRDIYGSARKDKNVPLLKLMPFAKAKREQFIYRVKGLLASNNSVSAFWMGNLLNKDLDGEEIISEASAELSGLSEVENLNNTEEDISSEILDNLSDVDEEEEQNEDE